MKVSCSGLVVAFAATFLTATASAGDTATILRSGQFREITDGENAGYRVTYLRMSADGSRIVFTTHPSLANFHDTLRIIDADGSNERVIFQDAGPELGDFPKVTTAFAISADGSKVVYARRNANALYDIYVYDAETSQSAPLLTHTPFLSSNETSSRPLEAYAFMEYFTLSGNGEWLFFINRFGPIGYFNTEPELAPDGMTLYRVHVPTGAAQRVYSQADLRSTPGVPENAVDVLTANGLVATNHTGSILMLPVGGSGASAHPPRSLLRIDPAAGASSATVVLDLRNTVFHGPSLNADGDRMVATWSGEDLEDRGLFVMDTDGQNRFLLDDGVSSNFPLRPELSADGSAVAFQAGSQSDVYWAPTDRFGPLPVGTQVMNGIGRRLSISADGRRIAFIAGVRYD
ncbi:MAG TPA: hypothetical protein PKL84_15870, partial [Candidatus Hydrogenedentes bacterium]|nr:hypothetical protein [Candidatus Hydrogenedentota bacterium]